MAVRRSAASEIEATLETALRARDAAHAALVAAYASDAATANRAAMALAGDDRFREAALWQNHQAFRQATRMLTAAPPGRSDHRRAVQFIAMLAQRYALKNDTIGFFGPVGWFSVSDDRFAVKVQGSRGLIASRSVYFEGWCIDALAERLQEEHDLEPWLSPRLHAGVWLSATTAHVPAGGHAGVSAAERRILGLCDGRRTAREIAREILGGPWASELASEAGVFEALRRLERRKLIAWRLEVAPQLHPEQELRDRIGRIGDPSIRERCLAALADLVDARDRVARAAGRPDELEASLAHLDRAFTRRTGRQATRHPGHTYAARALVYEDCSRACGVALGGELLDRLGPPLSIVLESVRWLTVEVRKAMTQCLRRAHAHLRASEDTTSIDAHRLFEYVTASYRKRFDSLFLDAEAAFRERWSQVLDVGGDARHVVRSLEDVRRRAAALFPITGRAWTKADYFSPDIMVAAADEHAFGRGEFHCTLGELHTSNTLMQSVWSSQHPRPDRLLAAIAGDTAHDTVLLKQVQRAKWLARTNLACVPGTFWRYEYGDDPASLPGCRAVPAAMLVAVDDGHAVRLVARDHTCEFDAVELFGGHLCREVERITRQWLPTSPHVPRVTIGDLTIGRETWLVSPLQMPFLRDPGRPTRFAAARDWAAGLRMPRHLFYASPQERKPCFLDLDSPVYVEAFVNLMKRVDPASTVRLVEMYPGIADAWLSDGDRCRYTSEFRFVARRSDDHG